MAEDPRSGTAQEVATSKKRQYVFYEILLGSGRKDVCAVRGDVAEYFDMGAGVENTGKNYKVVDRSTTGRELFVDLQDISGKASATGTTNKFALPKQLTVGRGGKFVTVPTELKTAKGNIRTARMHFPSKATLGAISNFLATKTKSKKPTFFITPRGTKRAVCEIAETDINANEDALTAP